MWKPWLGNAGVDVGQWWALTKVLIKKDFRDSQASTVLRHGRSGGSSFYSLVFFYFLVGLVFIPIVLTNDDVFVSGTLLITYTMFMIGSLILVEYHTVVVSPDDHSVLGYRPVTSRTFFCVKVTNILFYVLTFTLVLALPAILTFWLAPAGSLSLSLTAFLATFLANITTALAIVLFYTFILKRVSLLRLQNLLAFFQVVLAFLIYSGFIVLPRLLDHQTLQSLNFSDSPWLVLLPSAWFSSYLSLAAGELGLVHLLLALLSACVLAVLTVLTFSKLSMGYSATLASLAVQAPARGSSRSGFSRLFFFFAHANEERVVAKLIKNQFLHDNKFKMAVLGILPLTIFYLFIGTQQGPLPDPFVTRNIDVSRAGLLYLLVFLFPMMLRTYVTQSDAYPASWIFYTTPTDIRRVVLAEKNFLMIYFVLPFLFILSLIFTYSFNNMLHVLLHILMLGLLSHLFLQFAFLYSPDLPFSRPNVKGQRSRNMAMLLILVPFVLYLGLPLIFRYIYTDPASYLVFAITVLSVSLILESLIQVRVGSHAKKFEFPA
ncbi:MAG: hypothetical protein ACE5IY_03325 [bacterium]